MLTMADMIQLDDRPTEVCIAESVLKCQNDMGSIKNIGSVHISI